MSFDGWCLYRHAEARHRAEAVYQAVLLARFRREAAALSARLWADLDRRVNRSVAEWEAQWI